MMKKLKFFFVLLFLTIVFIDSFGQQKKIDSLYKVLANFKKHDTLKAKLMTETTELVLSTNPKKGLVLVKDLQKFSEKINFSKSIFSGMQLEGKYYFLSYKLDSALYFFEKAKVYATTLNNKFFVARANSAIASITLIKGKPKEAIEIFKDCIKVFEAEKNNEVLGATLVNLSNAYNFSGDRMSALSTAIESLTINNKTTNKDYIATSYYLIGSLYGISSQFSEALKYHKGYTNTQKELGNLSNVCTGYIAIANDYFQLQKIDSSIFIYGEAMKIAKEIKNENLANKISNNLIQIRSNQDKTDNTITELLRLNKYYLSNGMDNERGLILCKLALAYSSVSLDYFKKNGLDFAKREEMCIAYLEEASTIANNSKNYPLSEEVIRYYSLVYENQQNYVKAYESYKKYIIWRDSATSENRQIALDRITQKFYYTKIEDSLKLIQTNTDGALQKQFFLNKEQEQSILLQNKELLLNKQMLLSSNQELALLGKDKELQHLAYLKTQADLQTEQLLKSDKETQLTLVQKEKYLETAKVNNLSKENELNILKRKQILGYSIGILAMLLFGGLYFFDRSKNKQIQLKAALAKEKAEQQTKEAEFQKSVSEISLSALRSQMNPHFIFNCLNSIKLFTAQNDSESASNYLTKFSKLIRMALENSRSNTINLQDEIKALELYIQLEAMRFKGKLQYKINVDKNVATDFIEIPPMLLQPYVENAIWHGLMPKEDGGNIEIDIKNNETNDALIIAIKDDGVGRKKAAEIGNEKIKDHKSIGTKVTGERLALINKLFKTEASVHTEDVIKNNIVEGTIVTVIIPFSK